MIEDEPGSPPQEEAARAVQLHSELLAIAGAKQDLSAADPALLSFYLAGSLASRSGFQTEIAFPALRSRTAFPAHHISRNHHSQSPPRRPRPRKSRRQRPHPLSFRSALKRYPVNPCVPRVKGFAFGRLVHEPESPKPALPRIIQKSISPGVPHESSSHARRIAPQSIFRRTSAHPPRERRTPRKPDRAACANTKMPASFPASSATKTPWCRRS